MKKERGPSRFFTEYYASAFLFLIAGFIVLAFFLLQPIILQIRETNAETEARIEGTAKERRYLSSLEQSVAAAQSIPASTLDQVDHALPDEQNIPSLLVQFGTAAERNHLRIDGIGFSEARANPSKAVTATSSVASLDINLSVHARTYFDVKRFLADVETSLRLMDVVSISSSYAAGDLAYTLQLRTYAFVPPKRP